MKKVLILGASGLVGKALIEEFEDRFEVYGTYCSTKTKLPDTRQFQLEIKDCDKSITLIQMIKPDVIISCLRGDFEHQYEIHKQIASEIKSINCSLYYFSTANVFDGDYLKHHAETDLPVSQSDYGKFKINCENMLTEKLGDRASLIRIPAIWGKESPRLEMIKKSIKNNELIDVYSNLECNYHLDKQLAFQMRFIIEKGLHGIFHLGSTDMKTHGEFIQEIVKKLTSKNHIIKNNTLFQKENTYYFGLQSIRTDIPQELRYTCEEIIQELVYVK
ncbi:sugar nucleotide-binding protein [Peribacillus frigoritolerans]|uniref:sugar nucleotide-binding protein n=1 Tax=Peribacillus frigoritolerans TaxID=450367 RepID=UPI0010594471|nr:sugar nucleotide-binding protein [Peribacillus frigoritolerans]TDL82726.1 NAD-dependent epimerase/dehydratase family protein [Peribacillus frigoritolerans]